MTTSTLTSKGQTTIPGEVRKALGLKPKQRLMYEVNGHQAILKAVEGTLLDLFGSVKVPSGASHNWKKIEEMVHHTVAKRWVHKRK